MVDIVGRVPVSAATAVVRGLFALPRPVRRLIAGRPIRRDGRVLDLDMQLLIRLMSLDSGAALVQRRSTPARQRARLEAGAPLVSGRKISGVDTRELTIAHESGSMRARLYTPAGLASGSPLLVYFHGGGWVIGSIDTHDNTCRFLAKQASTRVLSVEYRLAPENPFPAAVDDAVTAFGFAVAHATALGADPGLVAVGGDSAGANLAAGVCSIVARDGGVRPVFALLFYPGTDGTLRRPSRDRFADIYLTDEAIDWFLENYIPDVAQRADPRFSVLLSDNLADFPPTMVCVGDFDPLHDEGVDLGERLAMAGVPVVVRSQPGLIHGFANFIGISAHAREAVAQASGALRTGFALASSVGQRTTRQRVS
jgi:acetyl esterase